MKIKKKFFLIFVVSIFPFACFADLPVIDWASVSQEITMVEKMRQQLVQAKNLVNTSSDQYKFLQQDIKGNFGYGNLLNSASDLNRRQWSNDNWVDVLNEVSTGKTSQFTEAQKAYEKIYPVLPSSQIGSSLKDGDLARNYYEQSSEINRAALAASAYSYDEINQHVQNIHDILAKLESQPSEKAAIDLNTRLVAEVGFLEVEMLKQQNIQTQLMATSSQGQVNGMSDQTKFMQFNPH